MIRAFIDTNVWLASLSGRNRSQSSLIRTLAATGVIRPVSCERQLREALITIGRESRLDPIRHGFGLVALMQTLIGTGRIEVASDPHGIPIVTADVEFREKTQAPKVPLIDTASFIDMIRTDLGATRSAALVDAFFKAPRSL